MAEIHVDDLLSLIDKIMENDPERKDEWHSGVDAKKALYIRFNRNEVVHRSSDAIRCSNGNEIAIDLDENHEIYGIEIV